MKLIKRDTDYALKALMHLTGLKKCASVSELNKVLKIPNAFLRRLLQVLAKEGILTSQKGKGGGFKLKKKSDKIRITDIIEIFQGKMNLIECFLGKSICPNIKTCPLRDKLITIEKSVVSQLEEITIASLAKKIKRRGYKDGNKNVLSSM
ncbi:MAG: Rrf2 family transcriptional regulator [Candidatus Omnitrophota bacterium]